MRYLLTSELIWYKIKLSGHLLVQLALDKCCLRYSQFVFSDIHQWKFSLFSKVGTSNIKGLSDERICSKCSEPILSISTHRYWFHTVAPPCILIQLSSVNLIPPLPLYFFVYDNKLNCKWFSWCPGANWVVVGVETVPAAVCVLFQLFVYTCAKKEYAEKILDILDPQRKLFRYVSLTSPSTCVS